MLWSVRNLHHDTKWAEITLKNHKHILFLFHSTLWYFLCLLFYCTLWHFLFLIQKTVWQTSFTEQERRYPAQQTSAIIGSQSNADDTQVVDHANDSSTRLPVDLRVWTSRQTMAFWDNLKDQDSKTKGACVWGRRGRGSCTTTWKNPTTDENMIHLPQTPSKQSDYVCASVWSQGRGECCLLLL